jgi:hypothetical protein
MKLWLHEDTIILAGTNWERRSVTRNDKGIDVTFVSLTGLIEKIGIK